jgi:hypothetical protein
MLFLLCSFYFHHVCFSYNIIYTILTYVVPILAMGICYGRIGSALWGKGIIRENACVDLAQQRKLMCKRKVFYSDKKAKAKEAGWLR